MKKDNLGTRMKENYESRSKMYLMRRNPVLLRLDGKAFHTFTKGMKRPFDDLLIETMQETAKYLCENIQGCKIAYTQSDEITLLLTDYDKLTTDAWFDYNVQKMISISASMATLAFNRIFRDKVINLTSKPLDGKIKFKNSYGVTEIEISENEDARLKYLTTIRNKFDKALFDSRAFSIPKEEVCNAFIWRQQDATRNSIQMVAQSEFSHKEMHKKNTSKLQDMLMLEKGINWNDTDTWKKRGSCVIKDEEKGWIVDKEIPIFSKDREYIEKLL